MPSSSPYLRPSQPSPISKPVGSCFSTVHPLVHTTPYAGCVQTSHVTLPLPTTKASSSAWLSSCNSQPCQNPAHIGPGSSSALVALASVVLSTTQQPPFGHLGRTLQTHCAAKRQTYSNRWSATCKHQPQGQTFLNNIGFAAPPWPERTPPPASVQLPEAPRD